MPSICHTICTSCSDVSLVKNKNEGVKGREWWYNVLHGLTAMQLRREMGTMLNVDEFGI